MGKAENLWPSLLETRECGGCQVRFYVNALVDGHCSKCRKALDNYHRISKKNRRIADLEAALTRAIELLDMDYLPPHPGHKCHGGPSTPCDAGCHAYALFRDEVDRIRKVVNT